ncbi:TrmB family transcriptional regulator [uncultured Methanobrevibacter sp.]|uniref:TrmB family transcriptional regulator n=1 Tax=uncultured Methanobrevibacter sp. TaxID=253161 RepID=UPI002612A129|nr:helix-turn-helix domain-containing protein [uncultured Methanobrevibacter sp.]
MEDMINSLKDLGLSRYEAKAYIGLTKIITGNADEIAEISDLPRSRVYDILNGLEKKGFVSIQRERPLKYEAIEPTVIFKKEKEELISKLNKTEQKLEEYYTNQISEIQAPVWLIRSPENIIEKEMDLIKKSKKSITMRIGFLLPQEGELMLKALNKLPKNVKIRILANPECYVDDEKIDILKIFEKNNHNNLEIIPAELPLMKMLICDGKELFGTFAQFNKENNSIYPQTAIGVCNKYEDICSNFDYHFIKQFKQISQTIPK